MYIAACTAVKNPIKESLRVGSLGNFADNINIVVGDPPHCCDPARFRENSGGPA